MGRYGKWAYVLSRASGVFRVHLQSRSTPLGPSCMVGSRSTLDRTRAHRLHHKHWHYIIGAVLQFNRDKMTDRISVGRWHFVPMWGLSGGGVEGGIGTSGSALDDLKPIRRVICLMRFFPGSCCVLRGKPRSAELRRRGEGAPAPQVF